MNRAADMDIPGLAGLLSSCIDAGLAPERWNDFCETAAARLGATVFLLFEYDTLGHEGARYYGSRDFMQRGRDLIEAAVSGGAPEDDAVYAALARRPAGRFATESQVLGLPGQQDLESNPFRDEALSRFGSASRSGGRLNDVGPFLDVCAMHMAVPEAEVPPAVHDAMNLLLPVIGKSFEIGRMVSALASGYDMLLSLFDRLDFGAAFCSPDGHIISSNAHLRRMAAERDGLTDVGHVLGATRPADAVALRAAIAAALRPEAAPGELIVSLKRPSGRLPLVAKAAAVPAPERGMGRGGLALVLVIDPEDGTRLSAEGLAAFRLLSPEELELCDLVLKGAPLIEIADRRATTPEAAKAGIDAAAAKLACRSRLDLVRLAMATKAPLRGTDSTA